MFVAGGTTAAGEGTPLHLATPAICGASASGDRSRPRPPPLPHFPPAQRRTQFEKRRTKVRKGRESFFLDLVLLRRFTTKNQKNKNKNNTVMALSDNPDDQEVVVLDDIDEASEVRRGDQGEEIVRRAVTPSISLCLFLSFSRHQASLSFVSL